MQNITLYDGESNMTYDLLLSKEDAAKASSDVTFATTLLECAKKEAASPEVPPENLPAEDDVLLQTSIANDCEVTDLNYRWSHNCILMLLSTYQDLIDKFKNGKQPQKKYWEVVASKLNAKKFEVTGAQCAAKLRSLKKTYKSVKDHNFKSGNDRRTWQYFQIMDDIFSENAWAEPIAIASSSGLCKKRSSADSDTESNSSNQSKVMKSLGSSVGVQLLQKRIEQKEDHERNKNKRHEERLEVDKQLVNILFKNSFCLLEYKNSFVFVDV